MYLCDDLIILCICRSKQRLPVITYRHSWKSEIGNAKNITRKDGTVEVDVLGENIETGKVLLVDKNIERTGVTGEEMLKGRGGGGKGVGGKGEVKQTGRCHGCPVLSRYYDS